MSLCTDRIFFAILRESEPVREMIGARLFNTVDERIRANSTDDTALPYVVITNNGTVNSPLSKDDNEESTEDIDSIGIIVVARSRRELATIAETVRRELRGGFQLLKESDSEEETEPDSTTDTEPEDDIRVLDYEFQADPVQYDTDKPCFWQTLHYTCTTVYNYGNNNNNAN